MAYRFGSLTATTHFFSNPGIGRCTSIFGLWLPLAQVESKSRRSSNCIGALRTHGGDAHGREKGFKRLDARIARLSINAAGSLALFLIETWETHQHRALPFRVEAA